MLHLSCDMKLHFVFFSAAVITVAVLEPYPVNYQDVWDADHVRMPCSAQSLYPAAAVASDTGQSASAHEQVVRC